MKFFNFDAWLGVLVVLLLGIGLVFIFDTSSYTSIKKYSSMTHFFLRQLGAVGIGLFFMFVVANLDMKSFQDSNLILYFLILSGFLLFLVIMPGLGTRVSGASRWFRLFGFSFQPSEISKIAIILYIHIKIILTKGFSIKLNTFSALSTTFSALFTYFIKLLKKLILHVTKRVILDIVNFVVFILKLKWIR